MGFRFQKRVSLGGGLGFNISKSGVSPSYRTRYGSVLIIGSGNMVHNLGMVAWDKLNAGPYGYDWAIEASDKMKQYIREGNHAALINYGAQGMAFQLAIPSPDHYLPLLYTLALKDDKEDISFFNDAPLAGSLTMTSLKIG